MNSIVSSAIGRHSKSLNSLVDMLTTLINSKVAVYLYLDQVKTYFGSVVESGIDTHDDIRKTVTDLISKLPIDNSK